MELISKQCSNKAINNSTEWYFYAYLIEQKLKLWKTNGNCITITEYIGPGLTVYISSTI